MKALTALVVLAAVCAKAAAPSPSARTANGPPSPSARTTNGPPTLVALLLNPEANAAKRRAVVEVKLKGAILEDPPSRGTHLLVRLDEETPVATAQTRLSFHDLRPGAHTISVALVDADDKPLGAEDAVWLTISSPGQP